MQDTALIEDTMKHTTVALPLSTTMDKDSTRSLRVTTKKA